MKNVINLSDRIKKFAVCTDCEFLITEEDGPRTSVWYNNYCGAVERDKERDPFDGEMKYVQINDLGLKTFTDKLHPYARDINPDGNCKYYKEKSENNSS